MNLLTHPVTPIVAIVVAIAAIIAVGTKISSDKRKAIKAEVARKAEEMRVRERIAAERAGRFKAAAKDRGTRPVRRTPSVPAPGRPGFRTDAPRTSPQSDPSTDTFTNAVIYGGLLADHGRSSYDGGSSSNDGGSSSSSSDGGSSGGGGDSGGGGGGCD
jgi:uncharacterized membrane protein YgcG